MALFTTKRILSAAVIHHHRTCATAIFVISGQLEEGKLAAWDGRIELKQYTNSRSKRISFSNTLSIPSAEATIEVRQWRQNDCNDRIAYPFRVHPMRQIMRHVFR